MDEEQWVELFVDAARKGGSTLPEDRLRSRAHQLYQRWLPPPLAAWNDRSWLAGQTA